jgi:intracellular septation protein
MKELLHSARYLAEDMASMILFVVVLEITNSLLHIELSRATLIAVAAGMVLGVCQIAWHTVRKEKIDAMQWLSVALVIAGGVATFLTNNPVFVMMKPSVIHVIVGAFMLKKGWMNRYLPDVAQMLVPDIAVLFGFVWSGLMFFTAVLNVVVALKVDALTWAKWMSLWGTGSLIGLFLIQFAIMRFIGRRRVMSGAVVLPPEILATLS